MLDAFFRPSAGAASLALSTTRPSVLSADLISRSPRVEGWLSIRRFSRFVSRFDLVPEQNPSPDSSPFVDSHHRLPLRVRRSEARSRTGRTRCSDGHPHLRLHLGFSFHADHSTRLRAEVRRVLCCFFDAQLLRLAFGDFYFSFFCLLCCRYRLMLRRCIESSSPRFGMVLPPRESAAGATEYGTMLEIRSVQMLNDGRSMIETVGSWRFKVLEKGTLDGYSVGRVER